MKNEHVVGDAGRVYQAVRGYAEALLWNDSRNADTFAWLVTGLLQSQTSTLPDWITHRPSEVTALAASSNSAGKTYHDACIWQLSSDPPAHIAGVVGGALALGGVMLVNTLGRAR